VVTPVESDALKEWRARSGICQRHSDVRSRPSAAGSYSPL